MTLLVAVGKEDLSVERPAVEEIVDDIGYVFAYFVIFVTLFIQHTTLTNALYVILALLLYFDHLPTLPVVS